MKGIYFQFTISHWLTHPVKETCAKIPSGSACCRFWIDHLKSTEANW